ncbi:MAG: hypothetical protein ACJAVV_003622 [Alphaproteobacteria bacterium]|jgi:hypothetical protein
MLYYINSAREFLNYFSTIYKTNERIVCKQANFIALLCLICQTAFAQKHVHGEGPLLIAQQQWQFEFVLPAADLLGFKHMPETLEQKQQVSTMMNKIENVEAMIKLPENCRSVSTSHSLAAFVVANQTFAHSHGHNNEYMDIRVTYIFDCKESPSFAEASIVNSLDSLNRVNAQWISYDQQGAVRLTPSSNVVRFAK